MSKIARRALIVVLGASLGFIVAACGSAETEQAQVAAVPPTSIPTTAPLAVPTPTATPVPAPTAAPAPPATSTPLPEPTIAPTETPTAEPAATVEPTTSPATESEAVPAPTAEPTATAPAVEPTETIETPTPVPSPTTEQTDTQEDADAGSDTNAEATATPVAETPTAVVVASGEPPLECYDAVIQLYRAYVEGSDALSFEGGKVYCGGVQTSAVSAARSYRHSSGLIIQRNANYIFNSAGTGYIPFSGAVHFCTNGQPGSAPVTAETVPALLVVIDNEAQRQLNQGASAPTAFAGSAAQC